MNEALKNLIVEAVSKNISFLGGVGTNYSVQELLHTASRKTINSMWQRTKKELEASQNDSLFNTAGSTKTKELRLQLDTLAEIFKYKEEQERAAKDAEKRKTEASEKLAVLKQIKTQKELDALGAMSIEDIEKEIQKYS